MLRFAERNMSRKMDGEALPRDSFETVPAQPRSCSDRPRFQVLFCQIQISVLNGGLARPLHFHIFAQMQGAAAGC